MNAIIRTRLEWALTQYDIEQSTRRGYNPNALGLYLAAISDAAVTVSDGGHSLHYAINRHFNDRVLNLLLSELHEWEAGR